MISPPPDRIVYCYGENQQLFCQHPHVEFHQGLPDINDFGGTKVVLLIIDDLMYDTDEPTYLRKVRITETSALCTSLKTYFKITNLREP